MKHKIIRFIQRNFFAKVILLLASCIMPAVVYIETSFHEPVLIFGLYVLEAIVLIYIFSIRCDKCGELKTLTVSHEKKAHGHAIEEICKNEECTEFNKL